MKKILLLNSPPGSGKDTIADYLVEHHGFYHHKFAQTLKERTHKLYGMNKPYDAYEGEIKDQPLSEFLGLSPRQAYIEVSERYMKPLHGQDVWTKLFIQEIEAIDPEYVVVSDLGFQIEWETLIKHYEGKVALAMIYRGGCSFENDSRDYIAPRGPWKFIKMSPIEQSSFNDHLVRNAWEIDNSGALDDLYIKADEIAYNLKNGVSQTINNPPIGAYPNVSVGK